LIKIIKKKQFQGIAIFGRPDLTGLANAFCVIFDWLFVYCVSYKIKQDGQKDRKLRGSEKFSTDRWGGK